MRMRYFYEKPSKCIPIYGETYCCNHPVYNRCTLFKINNKGLAVIQQRYSPFFKSTWWEEIDPWLANEIYLNPGFMKFFEQFSGTCQNGLYPTVTVRQIMWALKIKPLKKERWETTFDHKTI